MNERDSKRFNRYYRNIYLSTSKKSGRGVFAGKNFKKGDIIEIAPYILDKGLGFKDHAVQSPNKNFRSMLVLGYGSLYNHSYRPNVHYNLLSEGGNDDNAKYMLYFALKDIKKATELTISYGKRWWSTRRKKPK